MSSKLVIAITCVLCALAGCDDCPTQSETAADMSHGEICGVILAGGRPAPAEIRIERVSDPRSEYWASTENDSLGHFKLECPFGSYVLEIEPDDGRTLYYSAQGFDRDQSERDTLRVSSMAPRREVHAELAVLRVIVVFPEATEDLEVSITARGERTPYFYRSVGHAHADVEGHLADLLFVGIIEGPVRLDVELRSRQSREAFWAPATRDPEAAEIVTVVPGAETTHTIFLPNRPAMIRGSVQGSWLTFQSGGVDVSLVGADSLAFAYPRANREDEGLFQCPLYILEPFRVEVRVDGLSHWVGGEDFASATIFDPQPGEEISGVDYFESGLLLDVVDPIFGSLDDLQVEIYRADEPEDAYLRWIEYSPDPQVTVSGLPAGVYLIRLVNAQHRVDWSSQWVNRSLLMEGAQRIDLTEPGSIAMVPISLLRGGRLEGMVEWAGAQEPDDEHPWIRYRAAVYLVDAVGAEVRGGRTATLGRGEPGTFEYGLKGVQPGEYKLGITYALGSLPDTPPDSTIWFPGTRDWEQAEVFEVVSEGSIEGINFAIP